VWDLLLLTNRADCFLRTTR